MHALRGRRRSGHRAGKRLVAIVHFVGDIRPPQEGVDMRSAIVEAGAQFDERRTGTQADAVHALEAVERVVLGHPDGDDSPPSSSM